MGLQTCVRSGLIRVVSLAILVASVSTVRVVADDSLVLQAGRAADDIALSWTGGSPEFQLHRADGPSTVGEPANRITATRDYTYLDAPPPGEAWFYRVFHTADCIVASADAYVSEAVPTSALGGEPDVHVVSYGGLHESTLVRFDLGSIPDGARIVSAELQLDSTSASATNRVDVRAALDPWDEATVTWGTRPTPSAPYAQIVHDDAAGWKTWDVRTLVREWADGARANDGFVLDGPIDGSADAYYRAREQGPEAAPRLCVKWLSGRDAAAQELIGESDPDHRNEVEFEHGMATWVDVRIPIVEDFGGDVVLQAQDFLIRHKDVWGLRDPQAELFLNRVVADADGASVFFGQRIGNVPVYASALAVYIENGVIVGTYGRYLPDAPAEPPPAEITPEIAEEVAYSHLGLSEGRLAAETEFLVYAEGILTDEPLELTSAWRVTPAGAVDGAVRRFDVYVDARTGDVLYAADQDRDAHPPGEDFDIETANNTSSSTCWNLPWETADDQWYDENGPAGYPGAGADPAGDGPEMFDLAHLVHDYFWDVHGRNSWDARRAQIEAMIYADVPNAAYASGCDHMKFKQDYITDDIVGHEYTHAVVHHTSELVYRNTSGALDESFADVFGEFVDRTPEWLHGEDLSSGENRSLSDPPDKGQPDHLSDLCTRTNDYCNWGSDNEGVHTNSGIPNKVAYLLSNTDRHNGIDVFALAPGQVQDLYFYTLVRKISENTGFRGAARKFSHVARVWARDNTNSFDDFDACQVVNAWASVGLSDPDGDCDGYPDELGSDADGDGVPLGTDTCPTLYNRDQGDLDGDGVGDACDGDDDNDGVDDAIDNCPRVANAGQQNSDSYDPGDRCQDLDGDGLIDLVDNCPSEPNPGQLDVDRDDVGDACDVDDDNDGITDFYDLCPRIVDPTNADADGDRVGDPCDNCPVDDNPDQRDTDRDGDGNACDDDDDNDGIPDGNDNCPTAANPQQIDANGDGVGLFCDAEELAFLDGLRAEAELAVRFMVDPLDPGPIVFPVFPCRGGVTCPDWLGPDLGTTVVFETSSPVLARIVDDRGFVVGKDDDDDHVSIHSFEFAPQPEVSYRSPGVDAGLPYDDAVAEQRFEQRRYYLEVRALPGAAAEEIDGIIRVTTSP